MDHGSEPCASIPKTHVSVDLVRCHHHQAWRLTVTTYREDDTMMVAADLSITVDFGPFDGAEDVIRALHTAVTDAVLHVTAA